MEPPIVVNEKVTCADCNNSSDPITLDDFKDVRSTLVHFKSPLERRKSSNLSAGSGTVYFQSRRGQYRPLF